MLPKTLALAVSVGLLGLPACEAQEAFTFKGNSTPGSPFVGDKFSTGDAARSDLDSVFAACEAYCDVQSECDASDLSTCIDDCAEPKLALAGTETQGVDVDCSIQYSSSIMCTAEAVCDEFAACDESIDIYVTCTLAAG